LDFAERTFRAAREPEREEGIVSRKRGEKKKALRFKGKRLGLKGRERRKKKKNRK